MMILLMDGHAISNLFEKSQGKREEKDQCPACLSSVITTK